jgi:hypothetical protein
MGSSSETGKLCVRHSPPPLEVFLIYFREQRSDVLLRYVMQNILINHSKIWQSGDLWERQKTFVMRLKVKEIQKFHATTEFINFDLPLTPREKLNSMA